MAGEPTFASKHCLEHLAVSISGVVVRFALDTNFAVFLSCFYKALIWKLEMKIFFLFTGFRKL